MKAIIPNTFRTGTIVDSEDVNANLQAIARDLSRCIDARYTYSTVSIDVTGLQDTDTAAERTIPFRGWATASDPIRSPVDIVGVEFSVYATAGVTWTLSTTDENGTVLALAVATAGATTEGYGSSNVPLQLTVAKLDFVLTGSAASTLTRATVTLHLRCDRHAQADVTPPSYVPTLIDASTSTAATAINAELVAAAAARTGNVNTNNNLDVRCTAIAVDNLTAAQIWRLPIGNTRPIVVCASAVGAAARSVAITDATTTITINTTGTSNIVLSTGILGTLVPLPGNPTATADDLVVTLTPTGGAISRVILFFWWR